ncbi:hypothetical protein [Paracoccus salsus]|uniref:hypothetical protein n=1 Tax=Paracoccus salsus TaxID=2911061 RepID=UPI001F25D604|nr:hypothetical protein [Paracoccus salsus]MCF3973931.1 hypothetical protein [Paracoccus salsus]
MAAKRYKHHKRGTGKFVQLREYLQASEAWATMRPGPRALYVEIKRRFNGSNNGSLYLSHRDAAIALNVARNTVAGWFRELEARGFIRKTAAHYLGPSGIGQASLYALEEETCDGKPATKGFMRWKQKTESPRKI